MEAKEKAIELVEKFLGKIPFADTKVYKDWKKEMNNKAKQCALIAVDEIINHHSQEQGLYRIDTYYWQQVKTEINNL
jgi:1,2-phenylacetyl-CoA epoxidase catalytic subunit